MSSLFITSFHQQGSVRKSHLRCKCDECRPVEAIIEDLVSVEAFRRRPSRSDTGREILYGVSQ